MNLQRSSLFGLALLVGITNLPAREQAPSRKARMAEPNEPVQFDGARTETYKTIGDVKLAIHIFTPTATSRPIGGQPSWQQAARLFADVAG